MVNKTVCALQPQLSESDAAAEARALTRSHRVPLMPYYCEKHDAYHLTARREVRRAFNPRTKSILEKYSIGLTNKEIASDLGITIGAVHHAVLKAKFHLGAMSLHHLLVIAMFLGLIDPFGVAPKVTEGDEHGETDTDL